MKHRYTFSVDDVTDPEVLAALEATLPRNGGEHGELTQLIRAALREYLAKPKKRARKESRNEESEPIDLGQFGFKKKG